MNHTGTKIKLVFIPLLILGIAFIIVYGLLYWLFYIQLKIDFLKEDVVQYWIPIGLAFIAIIFFIRPRIHLLKLDRDSGRIRGLYYFVASAVFCLPLYLTLSYLDAVTGKLTKLDSINDISKKSTTKYYTVRSYKLYKDYVGVERGLSFSGKHNEKLNFDLYFAIPLISEFEDTLSSPPAFLCVKFHKQLSSRISEPERLKEFGSFLTKSFNDFYDRPIHFDYLEKMSNIEDRDNFIIAARNSSLYKAGSPVVTLKPIEGLFAKRNGNKVMYIFLSFGIGVVVWFIMIIIPGLHENKVKKFKGTGRTYLTKQINVAYDNIKPRPGFSATPILIAMNVIVFAIMVFMGFGFLDFYTRDLIPLGALYEPAIQKGEWWRLITCMFLHGGFMHLLMNMIGLFLSGVLLELMIGTKNFFVTYFLSGIAASLVSMAWHDKPVVAVGASGAIFGLYGMLLYMIVFTKFDKSAKKFMLILLGCTAGYSLVVGFLSEGIDNSAHLGGLAAGLVLGFFIGAKKENK